jgi:hypothetical protein
MRRRIQALASSLPFLAACNGILGNDAVSLWPGDAAIDATTSDAAAEASCAAPLPLTSDAAAVACPPLDGGACGPQNISVTGFPWVLPTKPNNQCSPAQLTAAAAACLSPQSTMTSCNTWQTQNAANGKCFSCLFSDLGAATYGPYYVFPGDYATFNNAGCVMLLDPCWEPCARVFESYVDCDYNSCASSCLTFDDLDACKTKANTCACVAQSEAVFACQDAITASRSPAAACLTTDQNTIDSLLALFCGAPPDGG